MHPDCVGPAPYDLLLAGGRVLDPATKVDQPLDVAIADGHIAAVAPAMDRRRASRVIDVTGRLVTPGLVDLHGHYFHGVTPIPCRADDQCPQHGVTTGVDAGTSGWATFGVLRDYVIPAQRTEVLVWLNIVSAGYVMKRVVGTEFHDPRALDAGLTAEVISASPETVVGVKLRLDISLQSEGPGRDAFTKALDASQRAGVPIMLHAVHPPISFAEVVERLRPGDVLTHAYHGQMDGILDANGRVHGYVRDAYERGVVFDVGYAGGKLCDLSVARAAIDQGLPPTTLGTDTINSAMVPNPFFYSTSQLVGVFSGLGLDLAELVAAASFRAAQVIGRADTIGAVVPGRRADLAVFEVDETPRTWHGAGEQSIEGAFGLRTTHTFIRGELVWSG